jgi:TetR/AcrR family transcriptional regulator, regulator of autoinduction and epiphytic fitness
MASVRDPGEVREDGRTVRGRRTQRAVVNAAIDLVEEGNIQPTAEQVAVRAGVSLRTVYQHFRDRESLFRTAWDLRVTEIASHLRLISDEGPFESRLSEFLDQRVWLLERITPLRRAALLQEPFSEEVRRQLKWARDAKRAEPLRIFRAELDRVGEQARSDVEAALGAATSWASWDSLRTHQELGVEDARAAMERTIVALLANDA